MLNRPDIPLGLIVEGAGEYYGLDDFVRKGFGVPYRPLPINNAAGIGRITRNLEQLLIDLIRVKHPRTVLVCLDMADVVPRPFGSCTEMREALEARAAELLRTHAGNLGLHPLPNRICVIVQVPAFEAWLAADPEGLVDAGLARAGFVPHAFQNVDVEINDHRSYLRSALRDGYHKRQAEVAKLTKCLRPEVMAMRSRSFGKFWKEVTAAHSVA